MKNTFVLVLFLVANMMVSGQNKLVKGASFIDRFLPIESKKMSATVWGAKNVIPRDIENGIEEAEYSYWGGNIIQGDDGKEHLFVARWREDISKQNGKKSGHNLWWASEVAHAVSNNPLGPYKVVEVIGKGHNPEIYRLKYGSYIIGVMGNKAYKANSINGPWTQVETTFDFVDKEQNRTNRTYILREDGSVLMMNKEGHVFISKKANEHFVEVANVAPAFKRKKGTHEEDPVIWKDEVQYNLIMNDAFGRKAYHLTSYDGIHDWTYEDGIAYNPEILQKVGGTLGNWWKMERPKIRQDKYGRATHINFAVIDTLKNFDLANDNHSSKNIVLPLRIPKRLKVLPKRGANIYVKVLAEKGFNPKKDLDIETLRFGTSNNVNFGKGAAVIETMISKKDLILVFSKKEMELQEKDYKAKLLGRTKKGILIFGYALLK
jgi:hypothetical protein